MDKTLLSIGIILAGGIGAQWLAWRLKFPVIILLLACGFAAGPVTGLVSPDMLQSDLLYAIVGVSVAVILFEGSLQLKLMELRECGVMIGRLLTVGALVTWVLATAAAHLLLRFQLEIAVLFGAILIVTGPTVVQPMLRHIRPTGRLGPILKWEGIAIDSVGALAAVLVYEFIVANGFKAALGVVVAGVLKAVFIGLAMGCAGAVLIVLAMRQFWVPDFLHNAFVLMMVIGTFVVVSMMHNEPTGFFAVTLMGIFLANQSFISIKNIVKFKEDLRTLLLPTLFIILSARVPMSDLTYIDWNAALFVAVLILIIRPACVFASAWKSGLAVREQVFLSSLAPRGVVAATVSSIFAARMVQGGYPDAHRLVIITFFIIVSTVVIYGLSAPFLARWLGVSGGKANGLLILGAHDWACRIAVALVKAGVPVLLIDSNGEHVKRGRKMGLSIAHGNFLNEDTFDSINLTTIGSVLALTSNNEANALGLMHLTEEFGKDRLYQLADKRHAGDTAGPRPFHGRILFNASVSFHTLEEFFGHGGRVKTVEVGPEFDLRRDHRGAMPLLSVDPLSHAVAIASADGPIVPKAGQKLILLERP